MDNEIIKREETELAVNNQVMGFEQEREEDFVIPRVMPVSFTSKKFKDKLAEAGDLINSLTNEKINGKYFIPTFVFYSNIHWRDVKDGGGIICIARDGKVGLNFDDDSTTMLCKICKKNEFDNSKRGEAPVCTKFISFLGFIEGEEFPIVLQFGKTSYREGMRLYTRAKITYQSIWNYKYQLESKKMAGKGNEWFVVETKGYAETTDKEREIAKRLYQVFSKKDLVTSIENEELVVDEAVVNEDGVEY